MASYDLKRLEIAIQYIRRMSDGACQTARIPSPTDPPRKTKS